MNLFDKEVYPVFGNWIISALFQLINPFKSNQKDKRGPKFFYNGRNSVLTANRHYHKTMYKQFTSWKLRNENGRVKMIKKNANSKNIGFKRIVVNSANKIQHVISTLARGKSYNSIEICTQSTKYLCVPRALIQLISTRIHLHEKQYK